MARALSPSNFPDDIPEGASGQLTGSRGYRQVSEHEISPGAQAEKALTTNPPGVRRRGELADWVKGPR